MMVFALALGGCQSSCTPPRSHDQVLVAVPPPVRPPPVPVPILPEKPAPPASAMRGQTRLVNLFVDATGGHLTVDVWARRSAAYGPALLAADVAYGHASAWFGVPDGSVAMVVPAGAGIDGKSFGGLAVTSTDARQLGVLVAHGGKGQVVGFDDVGGTHALPPPAPDMGQVVLSAQALRDAAVGYYVGDGRGACRPTRAQAVDAPPPVLGGTQTLAYDLPPGRHTVTLHRWPGDGCKLAGVFTLDIDVRAGQRQWGLLHAPDGKTLQLMLLDVATP